MPETLPDLDCTMIVHEVVKRHPATQAVFQRYGLDTCCGGAVSVEAAARRDGIDAIQLCGELRAAAAAG
jgi:regulator of cell morphogenesis and NO signaling